MADLVRQAILKNQKVQKLPKFSSGDTIGVYVKVKEGEKERVQLYKGVVIKIQGSGPSRSFTVRKISEGVGVERTFAFTNPNIDKVEVFAYGMTRRSRLFYLRGLSGRKAKVRSELAVMREQREASTSEKSE
ncbi:MAG: 50S ribosomal protein L19 [Bdellovibrionales bacterium]|nr:50S ribosomal protein L19 [Bdellovibrionales bacterium]